ncbi:hypothetical protein BV20DRAFT_976020 [Pilatotrama ljubarskyi]|nr:hypothetical protein BV20DRAFT_976020 [Pilatotrama ljubarskyi]
MEISSTEPLPRPKRYASVLHQRRAGGRESLQVQMGLEDDTRTFIQLLSLIRDVASGYVNLHVPYGKQDKRQLEKIKTQVLFQSSILRNNYADGWPIDAYLRKALKNHGAASVGKTPITPEPKRRCREDLSYKYHKRRTWDDEQPPILTRGNKHSTYGYQSATHGGPQRNGGPRTTCGRSTAPERKHDLEELGGSDDDDEELYIIPEGEQNRPVRSGLQTTGSNLPDLRPSTIRIPIVKSEPKDPSELPRTPGPVDGAPQQNGLPRLRTPAPPNLGFVDMLRARSFPVTDVTRIAELFTSFGVSDPAYMRVFARMCSRDAWLRELRERGELSEIQMLVVRDVLETVAGQI